MEEKTKAMKIGGVTVHYLFRIPRAVEPGWFLVHNHIRRASPIGMNGFRVWLQDNDKTPPLLVCDCGWAAGRGYPHYRVDLEHAATA
jgi:hypothetical protein